jgi:hypothetical protein
MKMYYYYYLTDHEEGEIVKLPMIRHEHSNLYLSKTRNNIKRKRRLRFENIKVYNINGVKHTNTIDRCMIKKNNNMYLFQF